MDQELDTPQIISEKKAEMPDKILLAALSLFAKKGYFTTSLSDISSAANLTSISELYQHYPDKRAIAYTLYEHIFDNLNVSIDDIRRRTDKPSEQLRSIVDLLFKLTDDAPHIVNFLLIAKTNEFLPEQKALLDSPAFTKIYKIFQHGIKTGEIRNIDPMLAMAYFFGIISNTLHLILTGKLDKKADAYLAQTWLAAWNLIEKKSSCF
ncbi:MAG: TetR/AcrR family transcriptional regulator [Methylovulum sp.]|jgi:AcrR family transcriptional regulator|nr:TetR/AcrR family transcriptional regulator [Methylovulum sp.]